MKREITELRRSLQLKSEQELLFKNGEKLMREIIIDFDKIPEIVKCVVLNKKTFNKLVHENSDSFVDGVARGLDKRGFQFSIVKEYCKKPILQDYKKRNLVKWEKINELGFVSISVIAWAIKYRRKALPVFLNDTELLTYGYDLGLEEPGVDFGKREKEKYYDKSEYPPIMPSDQNVKWYGIRLTRGMRHQMHYLIKELIGDTLKEKNLTEDTHDGIAINLYNNPILLEIIFESLKKLKDTHKDKVNEIKSEMLEIYKDLDSEKKKEHLSKIEALNLLDKIGGKIEKIEHYNDKWKNYRDVWIELKSQYAVKDAFIKLKSKYPSDKNLNMIGPESFNRAVNKWLKNH